MTRFKKEKVTQSQKIKTLMPKNCRNYKNKLKERLKRKKFNPPKNNTKDSFLRKSQKDHAIKGCNTIGVTI